MVPFPHELHQLALQRQQALFAEAEHARLVRLAFRPKPAAWRSRFADALYAVGTMITNLAGTLGSERAKRGFAGGSEGAALRWAGEAGNSS